MIDYLCNSCINNCNDKMCNECLKNNKHINYAQITEKEVKNDIVNHPSHYTDGKIEVIDFIEDKKLNYHRGNAIKYISRAGKKDKNKEVEDLKKARWYIEREIERLENKDCLNG